MLIVEQIEPIIWEHIMDVDTGSNIGEYTKKIVCWNSLSSKPSLRNITVPSDVVSIQKGEELTPAMQKVSDDANKYDYETWLDINKWGKATGKISPRDTAFMGSIYYWCKRGKELSYKQSKYALNILDKARAAGWEE